MRQEGHSPLIGPFNLDNVDFFLIVCVCKVSKVGGGGGGGGHRRKRDFRKTEKGGMEKMRTVLSFFAFFIWKGK